MQKLGENKMFCSKCGKEMEDNSSFCSSCGIRVNNQSAQVFQHLSGFIIGGWIMLCVGLIGIIIPLAITMG